MKEEEFVITIPIAEKDIQPDMLLPLFTLIRVAKMEKNKKIEKSLLKFIGLYTGKIKNVSALINVKDYTR